MGLRLIPDSEISIHAPRVGSDSRYVQIHTCKLIELR